MAISEPLLEVRLTEDDLDSAQALVEEAGWNQTLADWTIFLDLGHIIGLRAPSGKLAATAAVLPHSGGFGWISMVLVTEALRRQGNATRLLNGCMKVLQELKSTPMLDATPAGGEVYRRLGFRESLPLSRWRRVDAGGEVSGRVHGVRLLEDRDWPTILSLDAPRFGGNRDTLLKRLRDRSRDFACVAETNGRVRGFLLGREGRIATQIGPVVAEDDPTATSLLRFAIQRVQAPVVVDAFDLHSNLGSWLQDRGFVRERPLRRMVFGSAAPVGDPHWMFAIAGPELG